MENLTLVIPAKNEKESLPQVLDELNKYNLKIVIVLEENDKETINSLKNFDCEILYQKNKGYGDALIQGIHYVKTKFFCIFNADGSFDPIELKSMYEEISNSQNDLIFASRYEKNCSSDDDTIITYVGNFIFTKIGQIFFNLKITDILYTFVMGNTYKVQKLNLTYKDFSFCVELPIKANKNKLLITTSKANERARIGGKKKVNAFKDGFLILKSMINLFFNKR